MNKIKKMLLDKPDSIQNILTDLEFYKVRKYNDEIICGNSEKGKGGSIHIKLDEDLISSDFKYGVSGDFITFLMKKRGLEFKDVLNIIKKELGVHNFSFDPKNTNTIFGGVYNNIKRSVSRIPKKLDESTLELFCKGGNIKFLEDGISFAVQKKWGLGFDILTQRITIPWRDYEGDLIGIMGRYNGECEDTKRWLPVIPFAKRDYLFGYSQNYHYLYQCDTLYLGESEKLPMQLESMGIFTGLGIGRSELSAMQIKKAISLLPQRIILLPDEGLPEDVTIKNIKAIKKFLKYYKIKVGYVYDENNKYLPKDSKASPTDFGREIFDKLIKNCVKEVV